MKKIAVGIVILFAASMVGSFIGFADLENWKNFYADPKVPMLTAQGHPKLDPRVKEYISKTYESKFYKIIIDFPIEEKVAENQPAPFVVNLRILPLGNKVMHFKIKTWKIRSAMGRMMDADVKYLREFDREGYQKLAKIVGREINMRFVMDQDFQFYYDLTKKDREIRFDFEIELFGPAGEKDVVRDSLKLKQATYATRI
ncbi:hypothetical protein N9K06_01425 [Omnitrophica bacterium]|nr:hypothetical protein [Candidatus Omnitrophota bacterium]